jgi:hypothetical protein
MRKPSVTCIRIWGIGLAAALGGFLVGDFLNPYNDLAFNSSAWKSAEKPDCRAGMVQDLERQLAARPYTLKTLVDLLGHPYSEWTPEEVPDIVDWQSGDAKALVYSIGKPRWYHMTDNCFFVVVDAGSRVTHTGTYDPD